MNFDDARQAGDPGYAIKEKFYVDYIQPLLKEDPIRDRYLYFLDQAWLAWRHGVKTTDLKNVQFVEWICEELSKTNEEDLAHLISEILDKSHDAITIIRESERLYYEADVKGDVVGKFSTGARHYKVFFESELRLWGSIPYFYICKKMGIKNNGTTPDSYVNIAAGEKFQALKNIRTVLPRGGEIKQLITGFDNELRNAGEGHDSYEITDNDTILLHVIDPKTGQHKGSKTIEMTYGELKNYIDLCRKSIWILRNGLYIFLNNHPEFRKKLLKIRPLKMRELKEALVNFADERYFKIENFNVNKDFSLISFDLVNYKKEHHMGSELLFGNGERYELITIETKVQFSDQILGILQYLVMLFGPGRMPTIKLRIFNSTKQEIATLEYEPGELAKLLKSKKEENIPIPRIGKLPKGEYSLLGDIKIPYGFKNKAIPYLISQGIRVVG